MFTSGFEKTAFLGKAVGALGGATRRAGEATVKGVKSFAKGQEAGRIMSYQKALGKPTTAKAVERLQQMREKNPNLLQAMSRKKPGFVQRHPYLTAGAAFFGAKALMGGGEQQQQPPPPQVIQY